MLKQKLILMLLVALVWEADTYTPAFFPGRALPAPGAEVRVWALPAPKKGGPKIEALVFEWTKDGRTIQSASGSGKNVLTYIAGNAGETNLIEVKVKSGAKIVAEKELALTVARPRLVVYEDEPLAGTSFHRAVGETLEMRQSEVTLVAEPYYFSRADVRAGRLEYEWRRNSAKIITAPEEPRRITFALPDGRQASPAGGQNENIIEVAARNTERVLQSARRVFTIRFGSRDLTF